MGQPDTADNEIAAVAELNADMTTITLYEDGEYIIGNAGGVVCSEHGHIDTDDVAQAQCDHEGRVEPGTGNIKTVPTLDVSAVAGIIAQDRDVQDETLERLSENNPEKLAEAAKPLFEQ